MSHEKPRRPSRYKVLLHNAPSLSQEFVVALLQEVFHKSSAEAGQVLLHLHQGGQGVAGVYPYEVAEMKLKSVELAARENKVPLRVSMEPEGG